MKLTTATQKFIFATLFFAILSILLMPQVKAQGSTASVKAQVLNEELGSAPVIGAIIEVTSEANPEQKQYYSTDIEGKFSIAALPYGNYSMKFSFLGLDNTVVALTADTPEIVMPPVMMKSAVIEMQAVVKTAKSLRASQSGDTLNYNASAFKVAADADVEGLLQKMPGIAIEDGQVTAQGESVAKIYVDGREFFGNDVAMALKSLPAEVVDKIEVYDKLSDESEYSGMDDGSGQKTINIVTKPSMRKGVFGKVFAGGGYEPNPRDMGTEGKYMGGGSANIFHDKSRVSVIMLANNLNQQNFSFEDIMGMGDDNSGNSGEFMVKPLPGVANVNALGVNYSDYFGQLGDDANKERVKVQMSYFVNKTKTENVESITRWYEGEATSTTDSLFQSQTSTTENLNQRINGRIDWRIDEKQSLMIRPSISVQRSDPLRWTSGQRYGDAYDDKTDADGNPLDHQEYSNKQEWIWEGYNVGANFNYRYSLGEAGNITAGGSFSFNNYDNEAATTTFGNYNEEPFDYDDDPTFKFKRSPSTRRNLSGNVGYNKQIAPNFSSSITYRLSQNRQTSESYTYYTDDTFIINEDSELIPSASNSAVSTYLTHKIGPSLRYFKGKTNVVGTLNYQRSTLDSETIKPVKDTETKEYSDVPYEDYQAYNNLTYAVVANIFFNPQNSLRIYANSWTSNPSISRIQDIYYMNNIEYISKGNPDLEPTYTNRLKLRYLHSNLEHGSTFMAYVSAEKTDNYLATHLVYNPGAFVINDGAVSESFDESEVIQYTTYTNLNDYWSFYTKVNYGMPLDFIKCNFNISGALSYNLIPSIYGGTPNADGHVINEDGTINGGEVNTIKKMSYRLGTVLGSNISENVDFTISWSGRYNEAANAIVLGESEPTMNRYYDQTVTASCKFVFLDGFTFSGSYNYQQYLGITNTYNDIYNICNAFIGHKVGAQRRGEVIAGVCDIFNQNTSFNRTVGNSYTENKLNTVLGRYYSVQFIYNMRFFGKGASTNMKDYK